MTTTRLVALVVSLLVAGCTGRPPAVTCLPGENNCAGSCARLSTDDQNCGSCANPCAADRGCANGGCYPRDCADRTCNPDSVCFDSRCVDKACVGVICPAGEVCSAGVCTCGGDHKQCNGACVDLHLDNANCGDCGKTCQAGQACAAGECYSSDCPNLDCLPDQVCVSDRCQERACVGVICPMGLECHGGACTCAPGEVVCGGRCAKLDTDEEHCGSCGRACGMGEACAAGECLSGDCPNQICDPFSVCYQNQCVEAECVGVLCPAGSRCRLGVCECPPGEDACAGQCVKTNSDDGNCGRCGAACPAGTRCGAGQCLPDNCSGMMCDALSVCTGGACVRRDCLGVACSGGSTCQGGTCVCTASGQTQCSGSCSDLRIDPLNCGMCGRACNGVGCTNGTCNCAAGQLNCPTGCVSPQTDQNNCGMCGRVCPGTETCTAGNCACMPGFSRCGGMCIPTSADNLNCGGCNVQCSGINTCVGSMCVPPVTCQMSFNTTPMDCGLIPISATACGVRTPGTPVECNDAGYPTDLMLNLAPTAGFGIGHSSGNRITFYNYLDQPLAFTGLLGGNINWEFSGSVFPCAEISRIAVPGGTNACTLRMDTFNGKYNTGGPNAAAATALVKNPTTMRVCDQVCGALYNHGCGDNAEYYSLTLGPGKAAVVESLFSPYGNSGGQVAFRVLLPTGVPVCNTMPTNPSITGLSQFRGRIVNNTSQPMQLLVAPTTVGGQWAGVYYNFAVAEEP